MPRPREQRFADLAAVLARAVKDGALQANHALRIIRHELRRMNVNSAMKAPTRSEGAQSVIDRYSATGKPVPKNGSDDALHCDHVNPVSAEDLGRLLTSQAWLAELPSMTEVVCVTAAENYRLQPFEKAGAIGWAKYEIAGMSLIDLDGDPKS